MATTTVLTQNYDIDLIVRDYLLDMQKEDPLMALMPLAYKDASKVVWERRDNYYGLIPLRGINGTPDVLQLPGAKRFAIDPGYYGGQHVIDEEMITKQRELGTPNETVDEEMLLSDATQSLATMIFNRIRQVIATLLTTGEFKVENRGGAKVHQYKVDGYNLLTAATAWSNTSTGTPIADMQIMRNTLALGTNSDFGPKSKVLMSPVLSQVVMQTNEVKSVIKGQYGSTEIGLEGLNRILNGYGLPAIEEYNESYAATIAASATPSNYTRFLGATKFIWAGVRPNNAPFGQFQMTRNMVNQKSMSAAPDYRVEFDGPDDLRRGIYNLVQYVSMPPMYTVDAGFNGGPSIFYTSAVAGITTT
jgi:hypothetical protein